MEELDALEDKLGVKFRDRGLLQLALIHSSFLNENPGVYPESNERLEFLGDALLGVAVAYDLYQRHPERHEGELTAIRADIIKGESLAQAAKRLGLGQRIIMGKGEEANRGRERQRNLAGVFEALVGALFLDQGYEAARDFALRIVSDRIARATRRGIPKNPKSILQELMQGQGKPSPTYRVVQRTGQQHDLEFTVEALVGGAVMGRGTGRRKAIAEQEAARAAIRALESDV